MKTSIIHKILAAMIFAAMSVPAMALQIVVDGIYYEVHDDKLEMTENPDKYSGVVIVPSTVVYEGITYTVTQIDIKAFRDCTGLFSIGISSTVNDIDPLTFSGCESLEEIYVDPDNTTYASYDRALYTKDLTTIIRCPATITGVYEIAPEATTIGYDAFSDCKMLTDIILPETVNNIGHYAFENCSSLTKIHLPDAITTINECTFSGCSSLADINIPKDLTSIELGAFRSCAIKTMEIPEKVMNIAGWAFRGCYKLENITLPSHLTEIPDGLLSGCKSLKEIDIPQNVTKIGESAFSGCESLKEVKIPECAIDLGDHLFSSCKSLITVNIPDGVTAIKRFDFNYCESLLSITLPNSVTEICDIAFRSCTSLQSITIPENVETIGSQAFSGCDTLNDITCMSRIPPAIAGNTFTHYRTLHVPAGSEQLYAMAEGWKNFNIVGDAPAYDGINDIEAGTKQTQAPAQYYGIDGKRLTTASPKGITIVKTGDGKTKKITSGKRQ